jgi:hypothetical protein
LLFLEPCVALSRQSSQTSWNKLTKIVTTLGWAQSILALAPRRLIAAGSTNALVAAVGALSVLF